MRSRIAGPAVRHGLRAGLLLLCAAALPAAPVLAQTKTNARPAAAEPKLLEPVNKEASPEARALLRYLQSISGRYTLSGQHNFPHTIARWTDRFYAFTDRYPAVYGQDFGFQGGEDKDSVEARPALVAEAIRQYRSGAVVTLTWHAVRPTDDEPVTFRDSVQGKLSDFEWRELLTPGTSLNARWCAQVDVIAGFLRQLRDARVPVLFRPLHEMNGAWFWWGGRKGQDGSAALYRALFERLTKVQRLDNLVWVWNANAPNPSPGGPGPYADFFPGVEYADVLSVDNYGEYVRSNYDDLVAIAGGKPVALGEVGTAPTPEILREQPGWTWFMIWSEFVEEANPTDALRALVRSPAVANRDDPRLAKAMASIRAASAAPAPRPVTEDATAEAKALLLRLHEVSGRQTLSGQDDEPLAPAAASVRVSEVAGRRPALYGQELAIPVTAADTAAARRAIVEEARRQHAEGAIVTLSWRPSSPTVDERGTSSEAGVGVALTDFEWNELLTGGTNLEQRWRKQTDALADALKRLQDDGVPVLLRPYPQPNDRKAWWAGRKGVRGSAELYRRLHERLTREHGLRNLVWVWTAAAPGWGPGGPGPYGDFFPGHAYTDALSVDVEIADPRARLEKALATFAVGKPIGLGSRSGLPPAELFAQQKSWSWFLSGARALTSFTADAADVAKRAESLRVLYADPRIVSREPAAPAAGPR